MHTPNDATSDTTTSAANPSADEPTTEATIAAAQEPAQEARPEPTLPKAYDPKAVEGKWYAFWKENGFFHAEPDPNKQPYCITIPPPNITGSLHMGHALNNSVLDTMTRWHRMRGFCTLCLPGTDHAGIATQNVVEREIAKEGLTRHDLGREKFTERCWQWREQYGTRIYYQFEKLGCSYDWERVRFTLDPSYVDAVVEEFGRWYERGLIYRGTRVVNWDVKFQSAVSDIEVLTETRQGKLYHFRYPFADGSGQITIATTRPETLLGDAAVAANPNDERYQPLFGKMLKLPLTDREIPLIADEYAKMEFGSGAVKVTPAHDLDDFEAGLRHSLPQLVVIGKDGRMTALAGPDYEGMERFEARKKVVADMEALGLVEKIEDYTIQTPISERSKEVIEPLLSEQWFVDMKPLAQPAIDVVKQGKIRFIPERYEGIYLYWMENIRDWCLSRQLWWGHRIPVWWTEEPEVERSNHGEHGGHGGETEETGTGQSKSGNASSAAVRSYGNRRYTFARTKEKAVALLGTENCWQDEDVLDTWFSSALWPHATLGWPRDTADLRYFYPTNLLSTAQEILYLWVARMIMTGLDFMDDIPFRDVYIHATVLDDQGRRMSKSLGNGIDPIDLIEKYGADATRFSLLQQAGKNQDIKYSEQRTDVAGNFCNKLWNASRFVLMNLDENTTGELPARAEQTGADRWILSQLRDTIAAVNAHLGAYDMDDATRALYDFFWSDFCDWYVEMAKPRLRSEGQAKKTAQNMLAYVLETTLRLLHPMIPFITEEIWQALPQNRGKGEAQDTRYKIQDEDEEQPKIQNPKSKIPSSLCVAPYPDADTYAEWGDPAACQAIAYTIAATRAMRNMRAELGIPPSARLTAAIVATHSQAEAALRENGDLIGDLARLQTGLLFLNAPPSPERGQTGKWIGTPTEGMEVFLEIGDALDMDKERARIRKELDAVGKEIEKSQGKLGNAGFVQRAKPEVVEEERQRLTTWIEKRGKLEERQKLFASS
jgi:valyl-tRNA synthetase